MKRLQAILLTFLIVLSLDIYGATADVSTSEALVSSRAASFEESIEFCKTVAQDNITWIEGLQEYWKKPENKESILKRLCDVFPDESLTINHWQQMMKGYAEEKNQWTGILASLDITTADTLSAVLNSILDNIAIRKVDITILSWHRVNNLPRQNPAYLYTGNEENTQAQLDSLQTILNELFLFASVYREDYAALNYDYVGCGHIEGWRDKGAIEQLLDKKDGLQIVSPRGERVIIPYTVPVELAENTVRRDNMRELAETIELGDFNLDDILGALVAGELQITFPSSGLTFRLSNLAPGKAAQYMREYEKNKALYEDRKKALYDRKIARDRKKGIVRPDVLVIETGEPVPDLRDIDTLIAFIGSDAPLPPKGGRTGRRGAKGASSGAKRSLGVTGPTLPLETLETAAGTKEAAAGAGGPMEVTGPALSLKTSGAAGGAGEAAGGAGKSVEGIGPRPLTAITLELVARQAYDKDKPLPERACAAKPEGTVLDAEHKAMLSNLLKINGDGRYGILKATEDYGWNDLVNMLKGLGFTKTTNNKFIYDSVRQIGLHYLHYDDRRLNGDLLKIMFRQLANIGFTEEYLTGLLGS